MARFLNCRKFATLAYILILLFQIFLMFQIHYRHQQDSSKNKRELWYLFKNVSLQEVTSISNRHQLANRQMAVTGSLHILKSFTAFHNSYTDTAGIDKTTHVSNTYLRQDNVSTKQKKHKDVLDINIKKNHSLSEAFKASALQSWNQGSIVYHQAGTHRMTVTTPSHVEQSSTVSSVASALTHGGITVKKDITHVLNTELRQTRYKDVVEVNTKDLLLKNGSISEAPALPPWIPANIVNLSKSNISDIFECNLNASENSEIIASQNKLPICPCVPNNLEKHIFSSAHLTARYKELQSKYKDVSPGGHWAPQTCVPRHAVAIIVPYRDRDDHLIMFLDYMHRFLQKQLLNYTIIVAEQGSPRIFNKAKLMNAAYMESKKIRSFDCYVFHDVDMLPEDERNLYTCPSMPRHQGVAADTWNYRLVYASLIGGVAVYRPDHFELVNGYSNKFWGWGGEDDNMYRRIVAKKLKVLRPPEKLARYTMVKHGADTGNPKNEKRVGMVNGLLQIQDCDGLTTLKYKTLFRREKPLYTWMLFDITD